MKKMIMIRNAALLAIFLGVGVAASIFVARVEPEIDAKLSQSEEILPTKVVAPDESAGDGSKDVPDSVYNTLLRRMKSLEMSGTLAEIQREMDTIQDTWGPTGGQNYGRLVRYILGGPLMTSRIITGNPQVTALRHKYARRALERADSYDLETHWFFLGYLRRPVVSSLENSNPDERRDYVSLWLNLLYRLEVEKDPNFASSDIPPISAPLPPSGSAEQMREATELNKKRIEHYNKQHDLAQNSPLILRDLSKVVADAYANNPADKEELESLFIKARVSPAMQQRIIQEMRKYRESIAEMPPKSSR